jgi:hypothetical protein
MGLDIPMPTQAALLSWGAGLVCAVLSSLLVLRMVDRELPRRRRRAVAMGWAWTAALVPVGWVLMLKLDAVLADMGELAPWLAVGASWAAFVVVAVGGTYMSDLLVSTAPVRSRRVARPGQASGEVLPMPAVPVARPSPLPPTLGPPPGAPIAASDLSPVDNAGTRGLLRSLRQGPDFQRPAAARALSLAFAGTADPDVARALLDVLGDAEASTGGRMEAYLALHHVFGDELEWDTEVQIRREFPAGTDPDQVMAWEVRLEA